MKKRIRLSQKALDGMAKNLYRKQLRLRKLLHKACELVDCGEALLAFEPAAMPEGRWEKLASLANDIRDIASVAAGSVTIKRLFASRLNDENEKDGLEQLISGKNAP